MKLEQINAEIARVQDLANRLPERRAETQKQYDDLSRQMKATLSKYAVGLVSRAEKDQAKTRLSDLEDLLAGFDGAYRQAETAIKPLREQQCNLERQARAMALQDNTDAMVKKARAMLSANPEESAGRIMTALGLNNNQMDELCQSDPVLKELWEAEISDMPSLESTFAPVSGEELLNRGLITEELKLSSKTLTKQQYDQGMR